MATLTLANFIAPLSDYQPTGTEPAVSAVVVDSRLAEPGSVFVAFEGEHVDGHDFVPDAFARGAIAALVERVDDNAAPLLDLRQGQTPPAPATPLYLLVEDVLKALQAIAAAWRSQLDVRVVGITGSVGKTSTKELTASVLARRYRTLKSPGNFNNEIGVPLTLLSLRPEHERAVIEMGMYASGEIDLLCDMARPDIGVVTMIGPVHMERLGSMEAIVNAKRELVAALPESGVAVLNMDDPRVMSMASHTQAQIFTYGLDEAADLWADNISSMGLEGIRLTLHRGRQEMTLRVPLLGLHSAHTVLRATAVGLNDGLSWDEIVAGLTDQTVQLRLVAVPGPNGSLIIDDTYNSSPDSALAALNLLNDIDGRRIAVLGDMLELGEVEEEAHRVVGRRAADVADIIIAVGPRGQTIGKEALKLGFPAAAVRLIEDVARATEVLEAMIEEGDVILIKGSLGMHMDQIVNRLARES